MQLQDIWEKYPVYDDLVPTTRTKKEFKKLYKEIQQKLIELGEFPNKQARGLNRAVLEEIGEFPYWPKGGKNPVPLGEGEVHSMSAGEPRPESKRKPSQKAALDKRTKILNEADELMTAAGFESEVVEGKRLFSNQPRTGTTALDHVYETQEFGFDYNRLKEEYASGVIDDVKFKTRLDEIVSRKPGNIKTNLKLETEADNYAKMNRTRNVVKDKNLAELYKVRDADYTTKMNALLKSKNKTNQLNSIHQYAKQSLLAKQGNYASELVNTAAKAAKAGKTGKVIKTGIGLATLGSLAAIGPAGAALGAIDTAQRTNKYRQTGNRLDGIQAWLSGTSTATSATGIGEVVSMPLDITNLLIDAARYKRKGPIKGSRARFN